MYQKYAKRPLDTTFALVTLVIASPVILVTAVVVKLESKGPIVFTQERTGKDGKTFKLRKFRSMTHGNDVRDLSKKNEITRFGKILRSTSIDEIPQLINILRGEMSFIGPRPWIVEFHKHMNDEQRKRNSVLPGITGLAQAYGRNSLTIHEKIDYDLQYVENMSFIQDVKVILITIKTLFDKDSQEIEKSGIQAEIDILKKQQSSRILPEGNAYHLHVETNETHEK